MNVHFIAIGGSAMHNLAIALKRKGFNVTGSDDEIFEPSKSRLQKEGILPQIIGWREEHIHTDIDAVILGMHARADNPELAKAKALNLPIYSYPEYLYEQSKNKKRIVIGGSHGKTTITSMILHALNVLQIDTDYMVGAQLDGYDCMVKLTSSNSMIVLEGDEYLSSPIDRRPKFHLYQPHVALITGIAWDHINVFPTFENYLDQFRVFCTKIEKGGTLIINDEDPHLRQLKQEFEAQLNIVAYRTPDYEVTEQGTLLHWKNKAFYLKIFGAHNLQNLMGAMAVCLSIGIAEEDFLNAMSHFTGAGKRLEKVIETNSFTMFKDFAHSPSKLKATTSAVKEQFPNRKVIACMELHTFSSLKKDFLPQYHGAMAKADRAIVYFSPSVVAHKKLEPISAPIVADGFGGNVEVCTTREAVETKLKEENWNNSVLLMMSSGNFDGMDYPSLGKEISNALK